MSQSETITAAAATARKVGNLSYRLNTRLKEIVGPDERLEEVQGFNRKDIPAPALKVLERLEKDAESQVQGELKPLRKMAKDFADLSKALTKGLSQL